jgi:hypothetical protein
LTVINALSDLRDVEKSAVAFEKIQNPVKFSAIIQRVLVHHFLMFVIQQTILINTSLGREILYLQK